MKKLLTLDYFVALTQSVRANHPEAFKTIDHAIQAYAIEPGAYPLTTTISACEQYLAVAKGSRKHPEVGSLNYMAGYSEVLLLQRTAVASLYEIDPSSMGRISRLHEWLEGKVRGLSGMTFAELRGE